VTKWAENVIVGRTLKDKEKWSALLGLDGSVDFVFGSGKRSKGDYTLAEGEMCLTCSRQPRHQWLPQTHSQQRQGVVDQQHGWRGHIRDCLYEKD
jgi:hypothetical protein